MQPARSDSATTERAPTVDAPGRSFARLLPLLAGAAAVVVVDQLSKALIRGWMAMGETWPAGWELLRISHAENSGAAFGILQGSGGFLVITSVVAIVAVAAFLWWAPPQARLFATGLALILGGAVGNLIDRVTRGTVTDFIDPTRYPAFNLADSAIVIGVCILAVLSLLDERAARRHTPAASLEEEAQ